MKKMLAILLIIAMIVPMGIVAQAEGVEKRPFTLVNWQDPSGKAPAGGFSNVYYAPYFWTNINKMKQGEVSVYAPALEADTIPALAAATKELFDTYPEGARHINFIGIGQSLYATVEVCCYVDKSVELITPWLDAFLKEYKRIGGKLDGFIIDTEFLDGYCHYINSRFFVKDPLIYDKLVKHPTYAEKIRPELVKRGFKFYPNVTEHTPEIYGIYPKSGDEYATSREIWDTVMQNYIAQTILDCCAPIFEHYPDAIVSDYTSKDVKPWVKEISESGSVLGDGGNREATGISNENFYSVRGGVNDASGSKYITFPGQVNALFENNAFNRFLFEANLGKSTYLSSDDGRVTWWFAHAYYEEAENPYVHTPYYAELVFHLCLLNPEANYGYIRQEDCLTDGVADAQKAANAYKIIDDSLRQVSELAGYTDGKAIAVEPSWNHAFVLSGMYANGRNIWRITPDDNKTTLENFKVKDAKDPTFTVNGETVTFPGGKIIEDRDVLSIGTYGYWVETAADVTPVITRVEDYFRNYPTYQENFDSFETGMTYNYNNALPKTCWEVKAIAKNNSTATVIADPTNANNKVLELKGTVTLKNVKMPEKVNAGDTYAENQAWEVSVTLPADMAADAEIVLLNATNEKKKANDGGFKIAGGKVYYGKDGDYAELEGVTLSAGVEYTFVRELNFNNTENFTSNYYIYDAAGEMVGKAKNVPIEELKLPVYSIGYSCTNVSGGAVLVDDYKLYPTKVATDLYLYHADTGMEITETGKAQEGNVAYRLSWLNTTQEEKSYTLMAAYYDGETLVSEEAVQEIKMAANFDGVITGVVENKQEGKNLLVYLKDNNPAEPEEGEGPVGGDAPVDVGGDKTDPDTQMIIIIAAAAAVVVIAVVVIVIMASAKKKKKAGIPAEETVEKIADETESAETDE